MKGKYMEISMQKIFECLESTVNKSILEKFQNFLKQYPDVDKWFMCSDYCIGDKNKKNDVITFVIYPYILNFDDWKKVINNLQKKDLKHTRLVSDQFCQFLNQGYCFSFSFILQKKNYFDGWKRKEAGDMLIQTYINLTENWQITTPSNAENYKEMNKKLQKLRNESRKKNFNYSLFGRMMTICFLAGYLRYLLLREQKNIKLFSWLSDRDAITNWNDEIYQTFYHIISHCIIASEQGEEYHRIQEVYLENIKEEIFYDEMNRVADYICGTFADFDYTDGSVTGDKQCKMMEDAISSNNYIIGISVEEKGVAQICHSKMRV